MRHLLSPLALAALLPAQIPPDTTLVLSAFVGGAATSVLLTVDATGAVAQLGRFPSDTMPPLAVELDPIDREPLIALDLGGGRSRLLRLLPGPGPTFAGEVMLADLPGRCRQLAVVGDDLLAVVGGSNGGIFRLPRRGGAPVQTVVRAEASAMLAFGSSTIAILGWSGLAGPNPTSPGLVHVDTSNGQPVFGPFPFTNLPGREMTGMIDLPTGLSRQVLSFDDGSFALHVGGLGDPTPIVMTPQPPAGGCVAFKQDGYAFSGLAVGSVTFPHLYRVDWSGSVTIVATLPGDPVDLAPPLPAVPQVLPFGGACGAQLLQLVTGVGGPPQIGNSSFDLRVANALPQQLILFVAGLSDVAGGTLPLGLPGGCQLQVAPDASVIQVTNIGGGARQGLPIPAQPAFAGLLLFGQWLQLQGAGVAVSAAAAVQVWH